MTGLGSSMDRDVDRDVDRARSGAVIIELGLSMGRSRDDRTRIEYGQR